MLLLFFLLSSCTRMPFALLQYQSVLGKTYKVCILCYLKYICVLLQQQPEMASFMQSMNNPSYRTNIEEKLEELKKDPELADIMKEIEEGGPAAMTK